MYVFFERSEPMRRKKKQDAGLVVQREQRRKRKLEKELAKLEKKGRKFKPITEQEVSRNLQKTLE